MKITAIAEFPGLCYKCGKAIYAGDSIVKNTNGKTPVASHIECDPDFAVGGSKAES